MYVRSKHMHANIQNGLYYYYYCICLMAFFPGQGKLAPERQTTLDLNEARDDGVAVASVGPYANHLHLTTDR